MSRRSPGAGARNGPRAGSGPARHRWAASLGPPRDGALADEALPGDLLPGGRRPAADAAPAAPSSTPVFRWRTGRRAAALLAVMSVLLGGWFWWQAAGGAPRVQPLGDPHGSEAAEGTAAAGAGEGGAPPGGVPSGGADGAAEPAAAGSPGGTIVVHVAGAVASPGVLELPDGSRLHEAVRAAGGSTGAADLDRLNLAAVLEDGQKILVPERGSPDVAEPAGPSTGTGTGTSGATGPPAAKINLNTAGAEELATLPRVGPVLAQRIVDWRLQHGRFGSVEELDAVEGVGPKLLEALLPLVRV